MKQRIDPDQLRELTPEQQDRLRDWWQPEIGDWYSYTGYVNPTTRRYKVPNCTGIYAGEPSKEIDATPLLSIGQCIELLYGKWGYVNLQIGDTNKELMDELWVCH